MTQYCHTKLPLKSIFILGSSLGSIFTVTYLDDKFQRSKMLKTGKSHPFKYLFFLTFSVAHSMNSYTHRHTDIRTQQAFSTHTQASENLYLRRVASSVWSIQIPAAPQSTQGHQGWRQLSGCTRWLHYYLHLHLRLTLEEYLFPHLYPASHFLHISEEEVKEVNPFSTIT